ncbi:MAG: acetyltransferase, partial [Thermodesulfobacteriota bacterium]
MLSFLPGTVRGVLAVILSLANTLLWIIPLLPAALVKFLVRLESVRKICDRVLNFICTTWANWNMALLDLLLQIEWRIEKPDDLTMDKWYLVISNHQSWADILVLQYALNGVIPYFRFFLKKELRWFPILNIAWWALDYPYMTRYSRQYLEAHPEKKGKDLETTRESCKRFRNTPVSVMNFVEGTRFRPAKKKAQNSPFQHLLLP